MQKKYLPIFFFILLLAGMFWSRAVMSLTQGAWCIYALGIGWKKLTWKNPLLLWSMLPIFFWVLGAYQSPLAPANADLLLTWVMYPATVIVIQSMDKAIRLNQLPIIWLVAALIGAAYPVGYYLTHSLLAVQDYGKGKSLPTFMDGDHVRFSIFLGSAFLMAIVLPNLKIKLRILFIFLLGILLLFLSVRTGWAMLLLTLLLYPLLQWEKLQALTKKKAGYFLLTAIVLVAGAYFLFPPIQQKIAYSIWDWNHFEPAKYNPNYSDGTRRAINWAAWQSIQEGHSNAGWAGIQANLSQSFSQIFIGQSTKFGWPFNQWLFWFMGAGWWGMILFSGWLIYPIWQGWKLKQPGLIIWTLAIAVSCVVETTLNYQYGAFLHVFPLALFWQRALDHCTSEGSDNS